MNKHVNRKTGVDTGQMGIKYVHYHINTYKQSKAEKIIIHLK